MLGKYDLKVSAACLPIAGKSQPSSILLKYRCKGYLQGTLTDEHDLHKRSMQTKQHHPRTSIVLLLLRNLSYGYSAHGKLRRYTTSMQFALAPSCQLSMSRRVAKMSTSFEQPTSALPASSWPPAQLRSHRTAQCFLRVKRVYVTTMRLPQVRSNIGLPSASHLVGMEGSMVFFSSRIASFLRASGMMLPANSFND